MSKNKLGNNLLYLLSEKKLLKYSDFKKHIEYLYRDVNNHIDHIPYSQIFRGLSSLGYMDIGQKAQTGTTMVQVAPTTLVELPFMQPAFLLTGMRTPELLKTFSNSFLDVRITSYKYLPDTVIVYPEDRAGLKNWLENTAFQGNKLSSYIVMRDRPIAWDILELAGDLKSYQSHLEWLSGGDLSSVTKVFDVSSGFFKPFHSNRVTDDISLVEVSLYNNSYCKYFLFKKEDHTQVQIDRDWGQFMVAYQSGTPVLKYNIQKFELSSVYPFPYLFERGLALLSGCYPHRRKNPGDGVSHYVFQYVPEQIANLVSDKLGQKLQII